MAGHSKWANIKHRKAANDKKRGKLWTKLIREITVAAREGRTSDPAAHPRLRLAVDKGLAANMPKETIAKACKRGAGETQGANFEAVRYEGYGPGGVAVIADCLTDNRKRTVAAVRHVFSRAGGNLGTDGSVAYLFKKTAVFAYGPGADEDAIMEAALEVGAEDVVSADDGSVEVLLAAEDYHTALEAMRAVGCGPDSAEVVMRAEASNAVDVETGEKLLALLDALEDLDDVSEVYSNADIPDAVYAAFA